MGKFIDEGSSSTGQFEKEDFVKIEDGKSVIGLICGDAYKFRSHWNGKHTEECKGAGVCPQCLAGAKSLSRFRVNFVMGTKTGYETKIIEQGYNFGVMLEDLSEKHDLASNVIEISRKGTGLHGTRYYAHIRHDLPLTPRQLEAIKQVKLKDLRPTAAVGQQTPAQATPEP